MPRLRLGCLVSWVEVGREGREEGEMGMGGGRGDGDERGKGEGRGGKVTSLEKL